MVTMTTTSLHNYYGNKRHYHYTNLLMSLNRDNLGVVKTRGTNFLINPQVNMSKNLTTQFQMQLCENFLQFSQKIKKWIYSRF